MSASIEFDTMTTEELLATLPPAVAEFYRSEALRRREPVRKVMESALVQMASEFQPKQPPAAPAKAA